MTMVKFNRRPFEAGFNNLFDDFFTGFPVYQKNNGHPINGFAPVNIKETDGAYSVELVAPGFDKGDFKVTVEDNVLTISAQHQQEEKKEENVENKTRELRREYAFRSVKRSFTLDEKIDTAGIEAKYTNGVLALNLPKKAEVKQTAKEISIQ